MLYDRHHVFINGESYRAAGGDAALMRRLADRRLLTAHQLGRGSADATALIAEWAEAGWLHSRADLDE
jgi:50S ribosomal protein L16 3-hydroxylase